MFRGEGDGVGITTNGRQATDQTQAPVPDHSGGPRTNTACATMVAGHAPASHARSLTQVTHQHSKANHGGGPSNITARPTMAAGH